MVELPTKKELKKLKEFDKHNCVSIYVPHVESTTAKSQDRIRLKNALQKAEKVLADNGLRKKEIKKALKEAWGLESDNELWMTNVDDLAIFLHYEKFEIYKLPQGSVKESVNVGVGFDLSPLEGLVSDNKRYFILQLDHKDVKMYKADHYKLEEHEIETLPSDMKEALNIDELKSMLETHNVKQEQGMRENESFHGQYNVKEEDKRMLLRFFRQIDSVVKPHLQLRGSPPLVIAGVDHLLPIYRKANTYNNLLREGIKRNIKHIKSDKVIKSGWKLVKKHA